MLANTSMMDASIDVDKEEHRKYVVMDQVK